MEDAPLSPFERALDSVENFSDRVVAVLPEKPDEEMLRYIAHVTSGDVDKLRRIYELIISVGRLDGFSRGSVPSAGFAED